MISLDLDGTLLNSKSKISEEDKKAIKSCLEKNIRVTICTGKSYKYVGGIIKELGLCGLHAASNGTAIINDSIEPVWLKKIPQNIYVSLIKFIRGKSGGAVVHHADGCIYYEKYNPYFKEISCTGEVLTMVKDLLDNRIATGVLMLTHAASTEDDTCRAMIDRFSEKLKIRAGAPFRTDIYGTGAGKVNAIKRILGMYNIKREELMAIGDNENDAGIIRFAGKGIAMGNSPEIVKSVADYVAPDNDNNGIAAAINRYC